MLIIKGIWVPLHFCGILTHEKKVFWRKNDIPLLKIIVTWDGLFQVMKPLQSYHSKAFITNICVKAVRCDFLKFRWKGNETSWLKAVWFYWVSLVVSNLFHWLSLLVLTHSWPCNLESSLLFSTLSEVVVFDFYARWRQNAGRDDWSCGA